jgi:hypothetical protein
MPPSPRGSPCRGILVLATAASLTLSPLAHAAPTPDTGIDWGVPSTPKPAPKPAPAPEPAPAPAAAPAPAPAPAAADDDIVVPDDPPRARRAARKAAKGPRPARTKSARPDKAARGSLERAESERRPIQEHAQSLEGAGNLEEAARSLAVGAEAYDDPVLHLAAADAYLKVGQTRGRAGVADDDRSLTHVRTARELLATAPADAPRVDPEEHATLQAWADDLTAKAQRHKARMSVKRNGSGQIIAGALLTTGGLAGLGIMSGGVYLSRVSDRELAKGEGRPEEELAPLHDQKKQGETMIAAGAVAGAIGLALGIALVTLGARDLKASRAEKLQARLRVAPTLGGLVIAGRF